MRSKSLKKSKDYEVHLRLSKDHYEWLENCSRFYNCNIPQLIRILIDDVYYKSRIQKGDL